MTESSGFGFEGMRCLFAWCYYFLVIRESSIFSVYGHCLIVWLKGALQSTCQNVNLPRPQWITWGKEVAQVGVRPLWAKVSAIKGFPPPSTKKELMRFLLVTIEAFVLILPLLFLRWLICWMTPLSLSGHLTVRGLLTTWNCSWRQLQSLQHPSLISLLKFMFCHNQIKMEWTIHSMFLFSKM